MKGRISDVSSDKGCLAGGSFTDGDVFCRGLARSMIVISGGRLMTGKMALRGILAGMVVHGEALLAQAGAATMRTVDTSRAAAQVLVAAAAADATVIRAA